MKESGFALWGKKNLKRQNQGAHDFMLSGKRRLFIILAIFPSILLLSRLSGAELFVLDQSFLKKNSVQENGWNLIHLKKGDYVIEKSLFLASDTIIEGEGEQTTLRVGGRFAGERFISNKKYFGSRNIKIRSLKIEFDSKKVRSSSIDFAKGSRSAVSPGILRFENLKGFLLENVKIVVNSCFYAVDFAGYCQDIEVRDCEIINQGAGGCVLVRNNDRDPLHPTSRVVIEGNSLFSNGIDETVSIFAWLGVMTDIQIVGNSISAGKSSFGVVNYAIDKPDQTGSSHKVKIANNKIDGGQTGSIAVKGGARKVEILNNTIANANNDGIWIHPGGEGHPNVKDIIIRNNWINKSGRHGVFVDGTEVIVEGNVILNSRECGIFAAGKHVKISNNKIENASPGIFVMNTKNTILENNQLLKADINILKNTN